LPDRSYIELFNTIHLLNVTVNSFSISTLFALFAIVITLIIMAFVSAAETAFFSLTPTDMEVLKNASSDTDKKIIQLVNTPKRLLATLLISINFLSIIIVVINSTFIFGADALFDFSENPLLGFVVQVIAVTFLILIAGEITPKIYATQNPLNTTRKLVDFVQGLQTIFYLVSSFLIASTSLLDRLIKPKSHTISVNDLSQALDLTDDEDIPDEDHKILKGIVKFGNTDVKQIMKPRVDVIAFEVGLEYKKLLEEVTASGFSRVPIYKEKLDNIVGVLYAKDLLPHLDKPNDFNWQSIMRAPFYIPENKKIDDLLKEFQHKKIHLALIVDEYGGTSGIVTLEDVIEEIVGEINDEFDDEDIVYSKLDDFNYVFEGKTNLNDVCRIVQIDSSIFEEIKGDSDTLAGLVIEIDGRIPFKGDVVNFQDMIFTIESADTRKVKRVKITLPFEENDTEQQNS
jgi:putative hemolysin